MEKSLIDRFLAANADNFDSDELQMIAAKLESLPDSASNQLSALQLKSPITYLIISIFLGNFGVDRFLLKQPGKGILKLITCGGIGIWTIVDWFTVMGRTKKFNLDMISDLIKSVNPSATTNNSFSGNNTAEFDNQIPKIGE
ncbi:MAG: TM2 domain-containing protein [Paludibacteraceae bacterium]|nr:TM2 domain-containing protein [Paludibacteraceae bacterium]MBR4714352.1 TM2 domain-containing protein [Paludibacteraceae bacterium]